MEKLTLAVGALAFLGSTGVVSYIAVARTGEGSVTALGALIALVSAGAGFFLRGRVQGSGAGDGTSGPPVTVTSGGPTTITTDDQPPPGPLPLRGATHIPSSTGTLPPRPPGG